MALGGYNYRLDESVLHGNAQRLWPLPPYSGRVVSTRNSTYGARNMHTAYRGTYYDISQSRVGGAVVPTPKHNPTTSETIYAHYVK